MSRPTPSIKADPRLENALTAAGGRPRVVSRREAVAAQLRRLADILAGSAIQRTLVTVGELDLLAALGRSSSLVEWSVPVTGEDVLHITTAETGRHVLRPHSFGEIEAALGLPGRIVRVAEPPNEWALVFLVETGPLPDRKRPPLRLCLGSPEQVSTDDRG